MFQEKMQPLIFYEIVNILVTADTSCHLCSISHRDLALFRPPVVSSSPYTSSFHHCDAASAAAGCWVISLWEAWRT